MNFASDNASGAAPEVLAAVVSANDGATPAYGADVWTQRAVAQLTEIFETDLTAYLVATGTAANSLALAALTKPWEAVFCHEEAHIHDDECGAPEFFTSGAKIVGIPGFCGKLTPAALKETLARFPRGLVKSNQPACLTLSQVTEAGTVYTLDELRALAGTAHSEGLSVHMDGARFANALVSLKCSPAEMSWRIGVDALSFGATKNGALACEAVVFFGKEYGEGLPFLRKRGGHTLSKGRVLGAQMSAYLERGLWLALAGRANAAAQRLVESLVATPGIRAPWPTEANEVFVIAPSAQVERWRAAGADFHDWPTRGVPEDRAPRTGETMIRLVTSFDTSEREIESFLALSRSS